MLKNGRIFTSQHQVHLKMLFMLQSSLTIHHIEQILRKTNRICKSQKNGVHQLHRVFLGQSRTVDRSATVAAHDVPMRMGIVTRGIQNLCNGKIVGEET